MHKTLFLTVLTFAALVSWTAVDAQNTVSIPRCDSASITYRIVHPLHVVEATSTELAFRLTVDTLNRQIKNVSAIVDVMTFNSGNSNRDSHAMEVIDALTYPDVRFSSTEIIQHHDTLSVSGPLAFHGVTKPVVINAIGRWDGMKLAVEGTFVLSLTDFKIERPSMLMMPVEDTLRFAFHTAFHVK